MRTVTAAVLIASGMATRYDPGVMQPTVANRIRWGHVPSGTDAAECLALMDCQRLGNLVWLEHGGTVDGPYTVCDCAQARHRDYLTRIGFAVDLSYELAQELELPMPDVKVWDRHPAQYANRRGGAR